MRDKNSAPLTHDDTVPPEELDQCGQRWEHFPSPVAVSLRAIYRCAPRLQESNAFCHLLVLLLSQAWGLGVVRLQQCLRGPGGFHTLQKV